MNLDDFELQTRRSIEQALNQLQAAILQVAQLEIQLSETGRAIQGLSQQVEEYLSQQRGTENAQDNGSSGQETS
jgi:cell division protein FtsL